MQYTHPLFQKKTSNKCELTLPRRSYSARHMGTAWSTATHVTVRVCSEFSLSCHLHWSKLLEHTVQSTTKNLAKELEELFQSNLQCQESFKVQGYSEVARR